MGKLVDSGGFSSSATTAASSGIVFPCFLNSNEKKGVVLPLIGFENRFFTIDVTPSDKLPSPH